MATTMLIACAEEKDFSELVTDGDGSVAWKEILIDEDFLKSLEEDHQFVDFVRCEGDTVLRLICEESEKDPAMGSEIDSSSDESELCNEVENVKAASVQTTVEDSSELNKKRNKVATKAAFKCGTCLLKFRVKIHLIRHMLLKHPQEKTHRDERIYSRCLRCHKMFRTTAELLQHLKESHKSTFFCGTCLRLFDKKSSLNRHRKFHVGINPFVCEVCDKQCKNSSHLHFHRRIHYTADQGYRCPNCDRQFSSSGNCQKHIMRVHTREKRYKCTNCNDAFIYPRQLKAHQQEAHPARNFGPHDCQQCNVSFKSSKQLENHRQNVHLEEDRPYACDQCPSRFKQHGHLKTHKLTHSGVRPHACDSCDKRFLTGSDLRMHHRRVHKKLKPYKCDECHGAYAVGYMLKRHREKVHGI